MKKDKEIPNPAKSGNEVVQEKLDRANAILRKMDMSIIYESMKSK